MANTSSAKKAIRVSARKKQINSKIKNAYKKARKAVLDAVSTGKKKDAEKLIPQAYKQIDKAAKKNIIDKKAASRYKSSMVAKVRNLA